MFSKYGIAISEFENEYKLNLKKNKYGNLRSHFAELQHGVDKDVGDYKG